ncbi:histone acetylase complex subunit, partial [Blumeria hordei DH14]
WDDWVPQDRVRKFTDENKELAAQLHNQMKSVKATNQKSTSSRQGKKPSSGRGATNIGDISSARGSEERHAGTAMQSARGPRRQRDYDVETVSFNLILCPIKYHLSRETKCNFRLFFIYILHEYFDWLVQNYEENIRNITGALQL